MKLCASNIAWKDEHEPEVFNYLKNRGFSSIEVAPGRLNPLLFELSVKDLKKIKKLYEDMCLPLVSMQSLLFNSKGLHLFYSSESRLNLKTHIKMIIDICSELGINNIVFGSPKNRIIPDGLSYSKAEDIALEFFYEIGEYAFTKKTTIGIEANAKEYGGNFILTTMDAIRLIDKVASKGFKLNLDLSTLTLSNEDPYEILKYARDIVNHVHISEPYLKKVMSGQNKDTHINFGKALSEAGYDGNLSIEMAFLSIDDFRCSVDKVVQVYGAYLI